MGRSGMRGMSFELGCVRMTGLVRPRMMYICRKSLARIDEVGVGS